MLPGAVAAGKAALSMGHAGSSRMCQCSTFAFITAMLSSTSRMRGTVRKLKLVSMSTPRNGKRGASAMCAGAHVILYAAASSGPPQATSCAKLSRPRSAPHCVAARSVAGAPAAAAAAPGTSSS